ncbi:MAG: hypothetical protein RR505_06585 [Raoultibacter sp.]
MRQQTTLHKVAHKTLSAFLTACLIVGLAPAIALGDTAVNVKVEAPAQVNETVAVDSASATDASGTESTSGEVPESTAKTQEQVTSDVAFNPDTTPKPSQITTVVPLGTTPDNQTETLLHDGLTYLVDRESESATLTGWYGNAPTGDLSVPSEIADGKNVFRVEFAGGGTF